jgi:hypothetical protein
MDIPNDCRPAARLYQSLISITENPSAGSIFLRIVWLNDLNVWVSANKIFPEIGTRAKASDQKDRLYKNSSAYHDTAPECTADIPVSYLYDSGLGMPLFEALYLHFLDLLTY